jgi:dihydrofolate reductase
VRKLIVTENITLDGVMQAPGRPDEDTRGGFEHGGWGVPYADEVMGRAMGERMARSRGGPLVLGRRTYEDFAQVWPHQEGNPYSEALNAAQKYVATTTLEEPLGWQNSSVLAGDAVEAVAKMKQEDGPDLGVLGSGGLVRSLMGRDLVDEYLILIYPLVLGSGQRLFPDGVVATLELVDSVTTSTGVVIGTYRQAQAATGDA